MSQVIFTKDTIITIDDAAGNPIQIWGVHGISGLDGQAPEIDKTHFGSQAAEFIQGLQDFGSFTLNIRSDPMDDGQQELESAKTASATREINITMYRQGVPITLTFDAFVQGFTFSGNTNELFDRVATLRITGVVTWTLPT